MLVGAWILIPTFELWIALGLDVCCKLHKLPIWDGGGVASHDLHIIKKVLAFEFL
jgi:hypothetical protein